MAAQQQSQTITSTGVINQHLAQSSHQNITFSKGLSTKTIVSSQVYISIILIFLNEVCIAICLINVPLLIYF